MKSPKGTRDLLPEDTALFQKIEQAALSHFTRYGFKEIRTPIFEETELFTRGIGEGTDIVNKEMYSFQDKGGRAITLRPEMTASVCRALIQHNLMAQDDLVRLMYMGPMFRYERPQAGRYRQFHQIGVEVFGSSDPLVDIETLEALWTFLAPFKLPNLTFSLNSVGDQTDRPHYLDYLREALRERQDKLCVDCRQRLNKNVLRILDCKVDACQAELRELEPITEFLSDENREHFDRVCSGLTQLGIPYRLDPRLVRGLDYYTKTAFELLSGDLGAQSAVLGGGRYDNLIRQLGGKPTPGFGWAVGLDRLASILAKHSDVKPAVPDLFLLFAQRDWLDARLTLIRELRKAGLYVSYDLRVGSFKSQMKRANKENARFVLIEGDDEHKNGTFTLKNMADGSQQTLRQDELLSTMKEVLHA